RARDLEGDHVRVGERPGSVSGVRDGDGHDVGTGGVADVGDGAVGGVDVEVDLVVEGEREEGEELLLQVEGVAHPAQAHPVALHHDPACLGGGDGDGSDRLFRDRPDVLQRHAELEDVVDGDG